MTLRRSKPMQRKRARRRPEDVDQSYVAWVKQQRCAVCGRAPVEAHHAGDHGLGKRAPDRTCIPLCTACHRNRHEVRGVFMSWTKHERRAWEDEQIAAYRARYEAQREAGGVTL